MHGEVRVEVRFSWSLSPSPHQPIVVWPRRDVPPADRASGAKQRRYTAVSPSNSSIVLLLFAVVDNIFNLQSIPFFDLKTFGFCVFGLHEQGRSFLRSKNPNLKLEIEPHRKQPHHAVAVAVIVCFYRQYFPLKSHKEG